MRTKFRRGGSKGYRGCGGLGGGTIQLRNPIANAYRRAIEGGLDARANGPVRTLADMTAEERDALARQYGAPIRGGKATP